MKTNKAIALALVVLCAPLALAQDEIKPVNPVVDQNQVNSAPPTVVKPADPPAVIPTISPDNSLFKRTPTIDGQIEQGEWDNYYTFTYGDLKATTYVNWDDNYLYIASSSSAPTDLLVILDGNNDGWFHGADNYEITAKHAQGNEAPTLTVSRYDSKGKPGSSGAPLEAAESSDFTMKAGSRPGSYVFEIAIPRTAVPELGLKPGKKIGLKVSVGTGNSEALWLPSAPLGETQDAELVNTKPLTNSDLNVSIKIRDTYLTPREELIAKITVRNDSDSPSKANTIVVGGEGDTAKLLGSQLIRFNGLEPHKSYSFTFKSSIVGTPKPGSCALGVEVRDDQNLSAAALSSFDIVPPFELKLDKTGLMKRGEFNKVSLWIKNYKQQDVFGKVKMSLPEGWEVRFNKSEKEFSIRGEDTEQTIVFWVKPTDKATKKTPILMELTSDKDQASLSDVIEIE